MKKILFVGTLMLFAAVGNAQPPDVPAEKGAKFGEAITVDNAISPDAAVSKAVAVEGKKVDVKIKAEVVEVCQEMGCWIKIRNGNENITVKMKGHKWFVPSALNGKTIVLEGTAEYKITSVEDLKHFAEEAGKSKEEVAAIKEPKKEVTVVAKGLVVL